MRKVVRLPTVRLCLALACILLFVELCSRYAGSYSLPLQIGMIFVVGFALNRIAVTVDDEEHGPGDPIEEGPKMTSEGFDR